DGINKVILVGYVLSEPRLHKETLGDSWHFPLETEERFQSGGRDSVHLEVHNIHVPVKIYDTILRKGQLLHLEGKIKTTMTLDEQQVKRYRTSILVTRLTLL
ncbi:MAG TPA: single-stranded DNA-binding protein, partial [Mucilaginibacter sp.]